MYDFNFAFLTGAFYVGLLDGLLGVAGMMTLRMWWLGSFPKIPCVKRTSKFFVQTPEIQPHVKLVDDVQLKYFPFWS